jgi:heptosyltransferase II
LGEMRYGLLNGNRKLDRLQYPLMIQRFAALAFPQNTPLPEGLPQPQLVVDSNSVGTALARAGLAVPSMPVVALCHGAEYGPAKRWPAQHHATLANTLHAAGYTVWLFGSAKEQAFAAEIMQQAPHCVDLTGKTSLGEAIDLLSLTTAVVSNDSGLMHIAAALDKPLVALYGSSSPDFTPPLASKVSTERLGLECSPCFARTCPLGHLNCLQQLLPDRIAAAVQKVLI